VQGEVRIRSKEHGAAQWEGANLTSIVIIMYCFPKGPWFDFRRYQVFCEVVGLERGPLNTIEDLLGRNSSGSVLESREYGCRDLLRHPLSAKVGTKFADMRRSLGMYIT
jgi:hypothetical protein